MAQRHSAGAYLGSSVASAVRLTPSGICLPAAEQTHITAAGGAAPVARLATEEPAPVYGVNTNWLLPASTTTGA